MSKQKKAFTLIELLVVIAIIALLVSILLPSLAKAKEFSKAAYCSIHEKGFAAGAAMYVSDHPEDITVLFLKAPANSPKRLHTGVTTGAWWVGIGMIHDYVDPRTYFDPGYAAAGTQWEDNQTLYYDLTKIVSGGYCTNVFSTSITTPTSTITTDRRTQRKIDMTNAGYAIAGCYNIWPTSLTSAVPVTPHFGGYNVAYSDGSVQRWTQPAAYLAYRGGGDRPGYNPTSNGNLSDLGFLDDMTVWNNSLTAY